MVFDLQWNLQEFQYQLGIKMPGAPSSLQSAGTGGKHPQNIKRDILRKLNRVDPGQGVSDEFSIFFVLFGMFFPFKYMVVILTTSIYV